MGEGGRQEVGGAVPIAASGHRRWRHRRRGRYNLFRTFSITSPHDRRTGTAYYLRRARLPGWCDAPIATIPPSRLNAAPDARMLPACMPLFWAVSRDTLYLDLGMALRA